MLLGSRNAKRVEFHTFCTQNAIVGTIAPTIIKPIVFLVFWHPFSTFSVFGRNLRILALRTTFPRKSNILRKNHFWHLFGAMSPKWDRGYTKHVAFGLRPSGIPYIGNPYIGIPYIGIPYTGIPYTGNPYTGIPYIGIPSIGYPCSGSPTNPPARARNTPPWGT